MLEIKKLGPQMEQALTVFFKDISQGDYAQYFYPYEFTPKSARELCNLSGKDLHYVLTNNNIILGHGMLRGWDEGYSIPSLGIVIHPDFANQGLGSLFIRFLHFAAWQEEASYIRLSVHKQNEVAVNLYRKFGYVFTNKNDNEFIGLLTRGNK